MGSTIAEHLTERFYNWEIRGRGWYVYDTPITPEPPFVPFLGHFLDDWKEPIDDGREHTFISRIADQFLSQFRQPTEADASPEPDEDVITLDKRCDLSHLSITLRDGITYSKDLDEQFILNLSQCRHPVCLEFVGHQNTVTLNLTVDSTDESLTSTLLQNHFPGAIISPSEDRLYELLEPSASHYVVDWGLSDEFMLPLRSYRSLAPDPLIGMIASLGSLHPEEVACFQVLFEPVRHSWAESIVRLVTGPDGRSFFANASDFTRNTSHKLSSPLYGVVLRGFAQSPDIDRSREILRRLGGAITVSTNPSGNRLIPLDDSLFEGNDHVVDTVLRQSRRSGMLLSLDELLTFAHLPGATVTTPAFLRSASKTKAAPERFTSGDISLGTNTHAGNTRMVSQTLEDRLRHTYVIGASGSGKSTLLASMIKQDIEAGNGLGVLDPHGDLIDQILTYIPEKRFADVVLLDLADEEYPIPFNILSAHSQLDKNLLASDLSAVFERLATSWGDQMTTVLSNAILAFLESTRGGTLGDLRRFLVERSFREQFLPSITDPEVVYYWQKEFPLLSGKPQVSVVTRLNTFLRPKPIRYMVGHGDNRLDVPMIMDNRKIFLARIPQGAIGEENAYLLGTLLVSAFHRAAMTRQNVEQADRQPFFLYIDEFHHFITPSMSSILSGSRKYGLGLVLAHQEYRQLESRNANIASAVLANASTRFCFRLGDQDARRFEGAFSAFDASDLQNLGIGQAVCRIERADYDFNIDIPLPPKVDEATATERATAIRELSRKRYAVSRESVEARLAEGRASQPMESVSQKSDIAFTDKKANQASVPDVQLAKPAHSTVRPEPTPGRGGPRHKSIQRLIKQWAQGMGYGAQIEMPILHGKGAVDVALRKGDISIACEISVTTPTEYECANLKKCILADFTYITMLSDDESRLKTIKETVQKSLEASEFKRIKFMQPQELFSFIEEFEKQATSGETVRGYRVTVNRSTHGVTERATRVKSIKRTIADAVVRGKRGRRDND